MWGSNIESVQKVKSIQKLIIIIINIYIVYVPNPHLDIAEENSCKHNHSCNHNVQTVKQSSLAVCPNKTLKPELSLF